MTPQRSATPTTIKSTDLSTQYEILEANIGRSKIRNLLAKTARYNWLLFLDTDVLPKNKKLISNYLPYLDSEPKVVNGGILYQVIRPDKRRVFRWLYGRKREALSAKKRRKNPYLSLLTLNFAIHKSIFNKVAFNEEIPNLRHEDTLFSYDLMQAQIPIIHIKNPVYHLGIDVFQTAIRKENESLIALKFLTDHKLLAPNYLRISKLFDLLKTPSRGFVCRYASRDTIGIVGQFIKCLSVAADF
jgi:hypothetical protein